MRERDQKGRGCSLLGEKAPRQLDSTLWHRNMSLTVELKTPIVARVATLKDFFPPAQSPAPVVRARPSASVAVAVATSSRPYWKKKRPVGRPRNVNVQVDATTVPGPVVMVDLPATSSPGMRV